MNLPKRMPVYRSQDKIRIHWLTAICAIDALVGLLTMFGRSEGAAQMLLRAFITTTLWGGVLTASGLLIWLGYSVAGGIGGTLAWASLGFASVVTLTLGTGPSTSGPILPLAMAVFHGLITYDVGSGLDADREMRQRRE